MQLKLIWSQSCTWKIQHNQGSNGIPEEQRVTSSNLLALKSVENVIGCCPNNFLVIPLALLLVFKGMSKNRLISNLSLKRTSLLPNHQNGWTDHGIIALVPPSRHHRHNEPRSSWNENGGGRLYCFNHGITFLLYFVHSSVCDLITVFETWRFVCTFRSRGPCKSSPGID